MHAGESHTFLEEKLQGMVRAAGRAAEPPSPPSGEGVGAGARRSLAPQGHSELGAEQELLREPSAAGQLHRCRPGALRAPRHAVTERAPHLRGAPHQRPQPPSAHEGTADKPVPGRDT